jgi:hypothetical protein
VVVRDGQRGEELPLQRPADCYHPFGSEQVHRAEYPDQNQFGDHRQLPRQSRHVLPKRGRAQSQEISRALQDLCKRVYRVGEDDVAERKETA